MLEVKKVLIYLEKIIWLILGTNHNKNNGLCQGFFFKNLKKTKTKKYFYDMIQIEFLQGDVTVLIKELCTKLLDGKMAENENFIRFTFYELRVKNNLSEDDTNEFLRLAKTWLENKEYEVYVGNARYTFNNANQNVQPNELLIAFKNEK